MDRQDCENCSGIEISLHCQQCGGYETVCEYCHYCNKCERYQD